MGEEMEVGCARPTGGPVGEDIKVGDSEEQKDTKQKEIHQMIQVGQKAPDFTAPAYYKGEFTNIKLSDYLGKWNLLCFYPGDFTFV